MSREDGTQTAARPLSPAELDLIDAPVAGPEVKQWRWLEAAGV